MPTHVDVQHVMTQDLSLHSALDFKRVDPVPLRLVGGVTGRLAGVSCSHTLRHSADGR
jgi:hypothetical protein